MFKAVLVLNQDVLNWAPNHENV